MGGDFPIIGGRARNRIAAVDAATGTPTAFAPEADGRVRALLVSAGTIYAAGQFSSIGGQTRSRIAALSAAGAATAWNPSAERLFRGRARGIREHRVRGWQLHEHRREESKFRGGD